MADVDIVRGDISIGIQENGDVHITANGNVLPSAGLAGLDKRRYGNLVGDKVKISVAGLKAFKRASDNKSFYDFLLEIIETKVKRMDREKNEPDNRITRKI